MTGRVFELSAEWYWKERDAAGYESVVSETHQDPSRSPSWSPARKFPSEIHVELLKAGRIPDPFVGFNEHQVQCMSFAICCAASMTDRGCYQGSDKRNGCTTACSLDLKTPRTPHTLICVLKDWIRSVMCIWCAVAFCLLMALARKRQLSC